jgi:Zn-dependent peptidase ImmA (M78 family)/DNA-binding XRE family transcriptional regulator
MPKGLDQIDPRVLGARLQDARRAAGLTQRQVAEKLGVARTTIVAIEKGERKTSPSELIALAKLYRRQVSDLVGRELVTEGFVPQFRSTERQILAVSAEYEKSTYDLQRLSEDYAELEAMLGVRRRRQYAPVYETTGASPEDVGAEVAGAERNRLGLGDGPVGNLRDRLESDVELRIFYFKMPGKLAGLFAYNDDLGACIGINSNHPAERRQWSLAHEFGHFLMHRFRPEITVLDLQRQRSSKERVTDSFAENFLMPAAGLARRFTELQRGSDQGATLADVVGLAHLYGVSFQAMVRRLETLRRIPSGTWQRLSAEGFRVREAQRLLGLEADLPPSDLLPRRYVALAVEAFRKALLSEGQLARYLRTDRVSARSVVDDLAKDIHHEDEGDFTQLELDLAQPLSG